MARNQIAGVAKGDLGVVNGQAVLARSQRQVDGGQEQHHDVGGGS